MAPLRLVGVGLLTAVLAGGGAAPLAAQPAPAAGVLAAADAANVRGEWVRADALYRQALELEPDSVPARRGLAFVLVEQGRFTDAITAYEAVLAIAPRDFLALYNLAALLDTVAPRRALPMWTQYLAVATDVPEERYYVAKARARVRELTGR